MGSHQLHRRHPPRRSCPRRRKRQMDLRQVLPQSRRPCRIREIGQNVLVAARSQASVGEASVPLARSRRRWELAVTCACVVRHCASALAPPMGAITSGGLHLLGRIARDRLGLNLPDRVFRLIGNKPRCGAGRPSSPCHCRRLSTGIYRRPPYTRPCGRAPSVMPHRRLSAPAG